MGEAVDSLIVRLTTVKAHESGGHWVKAYVRGDEIKVGDRLDMGGKHRIAKLHPYKGKILVRIQTTGARSATVQSFEQDQMLHVYRKA